MNDIPGAKTNRDFKTRLRNRERMLGAFVKTPHPIIVEVMAGAGFDFLVLDCEHAPFERSALDTMILTGRALGCPIIVRIPASGPDWLLFVLDSGAAGIMVPHVNFVDQAEKLVKSMRYGRDGRGFAGTTRAAGYADRSMTDHLAITADETVLIAQIEDPEGAESFEDIASVEGVDALFVGRADLAVGYGVNDFHAEEITRRTQEILGAKGSATGLYCAPGEDFTPLADSGASLFVIGSEHAAIRQYGAEMRTKLDNS